MEFKDLVQNLRFDKVSEERILSFEYFLLNKNIDNLDDLKTILSAYTFINDNDLEKLSNLYLETGISFDLENEFLDVLNNTLYKKYLDIPKLQNLGEHIEKYNIILDEIYKKIQKIELEIEEVKDNQYESIEEQLENL